MDGINIPWGFCFISANKITGKKKQKFSVVRYGNIMASRGSVIPLFLEQAKNKLIKITDPKMTRFNISLNEGVNMVLWALHNSLGGEIFVPKIPSYRIMDLAESIGPNCKKEFIGLRPGEKFYEEMITNSDSFSTIQFFRIAGLPRGGEPRARSLACRRAR